MKATFLRRRYNTLLIIHYVDPKPGERILDMASAPGGKTSYIAQRMKNTGLILANDMNKVRIQSTISNLARLGVRNTIHCSHDGRSFPKVLGGFDRVLLDAPCSGLGVIARDPSVKLQRTIEDIRTTARLQKELLLSAIDSCDHKSKNGGIIVYSTCSISVEENEMVVDYALKNRSVKIVDSGLAFGKPGIVRYKAHAFHPSMKLARRLYPHVHNMDGFFVVKLKKTGPKLKEQVNVLFGKQAVKQKASKENGEESPATKHRKSQAQSKPNSKQKKSGTKQEQKGAKRAAESINAKEGGETKDGRKKKKRKVLKQADSQAAEVKPKKALASKSPAGASAKGSAKQETTKQASKPKDRKLERKDKQSSAKKLSKRSKVETDGKVQHEVNAVANEKPKKINKKGKVSKARVKTKANSALEDANSGTQNKLDQAPPRKKTSSPLEQQSQSKPKSESKLKPKAKTASKKDKPKGKKKEKLKQRGKSSRQKK